MDNVLDLNNVLDPGYYTISDAYTVLNRVEGINLYGLKVEAYNEYATKFVIQYLSNTTTQSAREEGVMAMPTWAAILIGVCGCTGIFNLITVILQHRWSKKDSTDERLDKIEESLESVKVTLESLDSMKDALEAQSEAQRASMEERIRYLVGHFHKAGTITLLEKANLKDMHRRYVGIGGNGNLDTEMDLLETIPVEG